LILLDTNIISESWRQSPGHVVVAWLDNQATDSLYLCTPVMAELRFGAERLSAGFRRDRLLTRIELLENEGFQGRILDFDLAAAAAFGRIGAQRERIGRRMEPVDAMIAAIAISRGMQLATRDTGDFADIGLELINPFIADLGY
jgi:predicted nucleic acid-binding protein